jgi:cell division protein FtsL
MSGFSIELHKIILKDLVEHRFVLFLYGLIVLMMFMTVIITADTKVEISQVERISREADELNNEWLNLFLEEQTLLEHSKVMTEAEQKLHMIRPSLSNEKIVED